MMMLKSFPDTEGRKVMTSHEIKYDLRLNSIILPQRPADGFLNEKFL